jgi:hypothetical protein
VRHHLLQRRICDQEVVDLARRRRAGATELKRSWRTIGLRIARIGRDVGRDPIGRADHRIEALEIIVAGELRIEPGLVLHVDLGVVEAATRSQSELRSDVEGVGRVEAEIGILG